MARLLSLSVVLVLSLTMVGCSSDDDDATSKTDSGDDAPTKFSAADIAENNRGVGLMGQFNYPEARKIFEKLVEKHPTWSDVHVNLAIALLNEQQGGKTALPLLLKLLKRDPDHLQANYCAGLLLVHAGKQDEALPYLKKAAAKDPDEPYIAYQIGRCLEETDRDEALTYFKKTLKRDPYFRTAHYRCFDLLRLARKMEDAQPHMKAFQDLAESPLSRTFEFKYTRMGPHAEAMLIGEDTVTRDAPKGALFADSEEFGEMDAPGPNRTVSFAAAPSSEPEARLLHVGHGAAASRMFRIQGDDIEELADHPLAAVDRVTAALWGDFNEDGATDVFFCRDGANALWMAEADDDGNVNWRDGTAAAGVPADESSTRSGLLFDADHDGDLDVCLADEAGNDLLSNNGDGTFRSLRAEGHFDAGEGASIQVLAVDLDSDRDVDIVILKDDAPHTILRNNRAWNYAPFEGLEDLQKTELTAIVSADIDADGVHELYGRGPNGLVRWKRSDDAWQRDELDESKATSGLAVLDIDGDGQLELFDGRTRWTFPNDKVKSATVVETGPFAGWTPFVDWNGRGPGLLASTAEGDLLHVPPGPGRHAFLTLAVSGRRGGGGFERSNRSGYGARVDVRAASRWTTVQTLGNHSGPGQGPQPLAVGLRGAKQADFVRIIWSDGVAQSELKLAADEAHMIAERDRMPTSCPVLFAWDGKQYRFVSDLLAGGGLGYFIAPGTYGGSDPTESFLLPESLLQAHDGRLKLKLTEPMEEVTYLDSARLIAIDVPPKWKMTVDERMPLAEPFPTGKTVFYRRVLPLKSVVNDRGDDVTDAVSNADGEPAPVGRLDADYLGRLENEHALTISFEETDVSGLKLALIADGWIEFPYSLTMFSAWQADVTFHAPTLEAFDGEKWSPLLVEFGYPAGMPRQMSVPIPPLPDGTTKLRLRTNQEIFWDRLAVAVVEDCPRAIRMPLDLTTAVMRECGFMDRLADSFKRPEFDYGIRKPLANTWDPPGFYTEFGAVNELVTETDNALAIFGPGEEVHLEFVEPDRELPEGWTRRYVLELVGWCKDTDLYTENGDTLGPIPSQDGPTNAALNERYNTRFQAGR